MRQKTEDTHRVEGNMRQEAQNAKGMVDFFPTMSQIYPGLYE